ncbi:MAG: FAD-binding protein [Hyphomicrobiales bacterium]
MATHLKPESGDQLAELLAWAAGEETKLEIIGAGTKRGVGGPVHAETVLDVSKLTGITLYEPEELVLSARAATLRADVEKKLAAEKQEFAFEPPDLSRLMKTNSAGTLGGMAASNLAGPRRIKAGAVRDHFLGFTAISGRGEVFKSGGRVVKNVTGYDLSKVMAGSWGTLAVMSDVIFKVLPAAETQATLILTGLSDQAAAQVMSSAMQSSCEVSGAAHVPAELAPGSGVKPVSAAGDAVTALRIEGISSSVSYRMNKLAELLAGFGKGAALGVRQSKSLWGELRDVHLLADDGESAIWRISVPPMEGHKVLAAIHENAGVRGYYDWAGGLIWCAVPAAGDALAGQVRSAVDVAGGHATLIRAPEAIRNSINVFHPLSAQLAAISAKLKQGFDPNNILNPGRMCPN